MHANILTPASSLIWVAFYAELDLLTSIKFSLAYNNPTPPLCLGFPALFSGLPFFPSFPHWLCKARIALMHFFLCSLSLFSFLFPRELKQQQVHSSEIVITDSTGSVWGGGVMRRQWKLRNGGGRAAQRWRLCCCPQPVHAIVKEKKAWD